MTAASKSPSKPAEEQTFDAQLAQLDALVRQLEQGDLPLEQALAAFEHGTKLVQACRKQLTGIELKVEQIITQSIGASATGDGEVETQPFSAD